MIASSKVFCFSLIKNILNNPSLLIKKLFISYFSKVK